MSDPHLDILSGLIEQAKSKGADEADAVMVEGTSLSVAVRLGETEKVERAEGSDLGLRVLIGKRQAIVSTSDTSKDTLDELVDRAIAMARSVPEDPYCGLAEPGQLATTFPDVDACDPANIDADKMIDMAKRAEDAARAVTGITNSEGGEVGTGKTRIALAASNGFTQAYDSSHTGLSVSVIAGEGTDMERDYDYATAVYASDLPDPESLGKSAAEKTVRRLNPRKVETKSVPVVFDPRVSRSIIGHLSGAINGASVARGTTFLKDKMGEMVFSDAITIIEDPLRKRGHKSHPFDGEGLPAKQRNIIDKGRLTTWFLNLRSARQLGLEPSGHASRGISSPPGIASSNLYIEAGKKSPSDLIGAIDDGFYVTELIGFGVNGITGDYSRGASGYWIEKGVIAYPVSEVTIAGNLTDMFANLTPASDLDFRYGTDAPTLVIEGMTIAGQ